jgi:chromosome segregation ATPase
MLSMQLQMGIKVAEDKIGVAKASIGEKTEELGQAQGDLQETESTKAADEEYLGTLKHECEAAAKSWEERQVSARAEMGAINKAIQILSEGVRVLLQLKSQTHRRNSLDADEQDLDNGDMPAQSDVKSSRPRLVQKLKDLSHKFNSYAFMEMAGAASMDPLGKVKGLIEEMVEKLLKEAQEEATQKAFCDEEQGKSKKSKKQKSMTLDKLNSRSDKASSRKAELEETVKTLEGEVAELDAANAEATKIRTEEHATYEKAHKDFSDAATAVEKAIKVLKAFYESQSLIQVSARTRRVAAKEMSETDEDDDSSAPELGGSKSDAAGVIIGILEMSLEDFTKLLMETEQEEETAQDAYDKLLGENKISKAAKAAEVKASLSEIKSLTSNIHDTKEDIDMTSKELSAVEAYLEELKPQCEEKTMSYAEKKAKREAEIEGLKEALSILYGEGIALLQVQATVSRH